MSPPPKPGTPRSTGCSAWVVPSAKKAWDSADTVAQDVIKAVGNYGEIYDRNLGPDGIGLPRENGRNALWAGAPVHGLPEGWPNICCPPTVAPDMH